MSDPWMQAWMHAFIHARGGRRSGSFWALYWRVFVRCQSRAPEALFAALDALAQDDAFLTGLSRGDCVVPAQSHETQEVFGLGRSPEDNDERPRRTTAADLFGVGEAAFDETRKVVDRGAVLSQRQQRHRS